MNYEPPANSNYLSRNSNTPFTNQKPNIIAMKSNSQDTSPLLRAVSNQNPYNPNYNNNNNNNNQRRSVPNGVRNRLGARNFQQSNGNQQANNNMSNFRNFNNRKRQNDGDINKMQSKRKWHKQYHPNLNNSSIQDRLHYNKNTTEHKADDKFVISVHNPQFTPSTSNHNESQEVDPDEITVQVVNPLAQPQNESSSYRFKMLLDNKIQNCIRTLQEKRKDKQVIFPLPVTPNATGVPMHERFSFLH